MLAFLLELIFIPFNVQVNVVCVYLNTHTFCHKGNRVVIPTSNVARLILYILTSSL